MTPLELLLFIPLAVLTNTVLPVSFDPFLVAFAAGRGPREAWTLALVGTACAAAGALLDLRVAALARTWKLPGWAHHFPAPSGAAFYTWTALLALSPLPFVLVRAALIRERPSPALYALSVAAGRLPRYILLIFVWQTLSLPGWAGLAIPAAATLFAVLKARADHLRAIGSATHP